MKRWLLIESENGTNNREDMYQYDQSESDEEESSAMKKKTSASIPSI
jgi:hypothetical protein